MLFVYTEPERELYPIDAICALETPVFTKDLMTGAALAEATASAGPKPESTHKSKVWFGFAEDIKSPYDSPDECISTSQSVYAV